MKTTRITLFPVLLATLLIAGACQSQTTNSKGNNQSTSTGSETADASNIAETKATISIATEGDSSVMDSLSYALGANVTYSLKSKFPNTSINSDAMTRGVSDIMLGGSITSSEEALKILGEYVSGGKGKFENDEQCYKVSYAFGVDMGTNILKSDILVQTYWINQAIKDVYTSNAQMTNNSVQGYLQRYFTETLPAERKKISQKNLAAIEKEPGVVKTQSGLLYRVEDVGDPNIKAKSNSDIVRVHYMGRLLRNDVVFDSSWSSNSGEPVEFPLNKVIAGWTEGLKLVGKGGRISLWIPSELAYGKNGAGEIIGPNDALYFNVELLDVI